jgi:hypothetical protein
VSERSHRLWDELVPVPTRKISCRLVVSHAGFAGESVLLEELYKRGLTLPQVGTDLYAGDGMLMFWSHVPIAPWQDETFFRDMRRSQRPNAYLRMAENRFVTSESAFIDLKDWDACVEPNVRPVIDDRALLVWIGIDASHKHDHTAIIVVTRDGSRLRLVTHRIFKPNSNDPIDFEAAIEATLVDMARRFSVQRVLFDPWQMQSTAQRLLKRGLPIKEFPQTAGNLTEASQNLYDLIQGRNLLMYEFEDLRLAISRAVAVETSRGCRIAKEKASHKIDAVVALAIACHAAVSLREPDEPPIVMPFFHGKNCGDIGHGVDHCASTGTAAGFERRREDGAGQQHSAAAALFEIWPTNRTVVRLPCLSRLQRRHGAAKHLGPALVAAEEFLMTESERIVHTLEQCRHQSMLRQAAFETDRALIAYDAVVSAGAPALRSRARLHQRDNPGRPSRRSCEADAEASHVRSTAET